MKYQITYVLMGNHKNYHKTTFKGTLKQAKDYAQAYRIKKHLPVNTMYIGEAK